MYVIATQKQILLKTDLCAFVLGYHSIYCSIAVNNLKIKNDLGCKVSNVTINQSQMSHRQYRSVPYYFYIET